MKNKLSKQQQKQRANLIFKYVKTLGPYSREENKQLYNKLNSGRLAQKQQPLSLTSRVYQMSVGSSKSKKRVTFVQNEQNQTQNKMLSLNIKTSSHSPKQKNNSYAQRVSKDQNPKQISKDLLSLQKQVYSTFRIKNDKVTQVSESTIFTKIPLAHSNYQSKFLELQLESKINQHTERDRIPQSRILRSQSQSLITNNIFHKNQKAEMKQIAKRVQKDLFQKQKYLRSSSQQPSKILMTNSQPSFSGVSKTNKKQGNKTKNTSYLNSCRSSSYWKQQNNLMIQIFRKKLQSKFSMSPSKQNWK